MGDGGLRVRCVCAHLFIHLCTNRRTIRQNDRQSVKQTDKYTPTPTHNHIHPHPHPHTQSHTHTAETNKHADKQKRLAMAANKRHYPKSTAQTNHTHPSTALFQKIVRLLFFQSIYKSNIN